jgi:SAM-dependent methyltransferase
LATGSIDVVISHGIIQQTRSPEIAFGEKVRVLKPGGVLSIGNLYSTNLHNQRVTECRHRYLVHQMPRDEAKQFLVRNAKIYTWLQKTGLWRLHRRWPIPGILQYCNLPGHDFQFYLANAEDYYMARYRHITSSEEVEYWCNRLGAKFAVSEKGFLITKV